MQGCIRLTVGVCCERGFGYAELIVVGCLHRLPSNMDQHCNRCWLCNSHAHPAQASQRPFLRFVLILSVYLL